MHARPAAFRSKQFVGTWELVNLAITLCSGADMSFNIQRPLAEKKISSGTLSKNVTDVSQPLTSYMFCRFRDPCTVMEHLRRCPVNDAGRTFLSPLLPAARAVTVRVRPSVLQSQKKSFICFCPKYFASFIGRIYHASHV